MDHRLRLLHQGVSLRVFLQLRTRSIIKIPQRASECVCVCVLALATYRVPKFTLRAKLGHFYEVRPFGLVLTTSNNCGFIDGFKGKVVFRGGGGLG